MWFILILLLAGPRLLYRLVKESGWIALVKEGGRSRPGARPILIYKANEISDAYIRAVRARRDAKIHVVGIIDDNAKPGQRTIQGLKILGGTSEIANILAQLYASQRTGG